MERQQRVAQALEQLARVEEQKNKKAVAKKEHESDEQYKKRSEPRASSTDSQARVMKMADGGFRPAYNVQFATSTDSQVIVGVDVNNIGSDLGQLSPMLDQVEQRYGERLRQWLVNGQEVARRLTLKMPRAQALQVYAPVPKPKDPGRDPYVALPGDSQAIAQWRERMGSEAAKASTSNAPPLPSVSTPLRAGAGLCSFSCGAQ